MSASARDTATPTVPTEPGRPTASPARDDRSTPVAVSRARRLLARTTHAVRAAHAAAVPF
ncbi:hypothetical protein [Pseudonocardia sp. H11422]|uniref:hypothetical protein n=1 Tax=Pseudonocardia sp. H11422 TaxID=2835866 RepID=UPI001BDCF7D8|nr:hypothetical protein [Pseudonocardia sp. H11422]